MAHAEKDVPLEIKGGPPQLAIREGPVGAATKLIWVALSNITADSSRLAKEWSEARNQFAIA